MKTVVRTGRARRVGVSGWIGSGVVACLMGAGPAQGALSGSSEGTALSAQVSLLGGLGIDVVAAHAAGSSPMPYNAFEQVASVNASALGVVSLSTGLLEAGASSDVGFGSTAGMASGTSLVNGLSLDVLPLVSLLDLSAQTIGSSAQVSHDGVSFSTAGGIVIEDAELFVSGVGMLSIDANAAPNTVLLDALGIMIILNEQVLTQNGDTVSLEVNALRIVIDPLLQAVAADVVIGHSAASLTVPAPGGALLAGFGALAAGGRRRRR